MKFTTLTLSTSLVAALFQFSSGAQASTPNPLNNKDLVLLVFKNLTGKEVINKATVSKVFNKAACDAQSPYMIEKNSPQAKILMDFCTVQQVDLETLLKYAKDVYAMDKNPMPTLVSSEDFQAAKDNAKRILDENTPSSTTPSYIN
ncbi:MAG: hypothetical protein IBJ00_01060 [Alphaproteobacteria bacterium]|nr:hypothetical protein [Alphaproteobacteria bacterium]